MKPLVTRKAILIGSPGTGKSFLSAVNYDLVRVKNFLLSDRGGHWFEKEIEILENPLLEDAFKIVQAAIADYVVVYFTGHGWANADDEKFLCLSNGEMQDLDLLNESPRQCVIIDACRKIPFHAISGIPEDEKRFLHADGYYPARELFNEYILNSPVGQTIIHSTAHDTRAYASYDGSYFTEALIRTAVSLKTESYKPLSMAYIVDLTSIDLAKRGSTQIPAITFNTGNLQIPFAFGFPKTASEVARGYKHPQKAIVSKSSSSKNTGWALVGIGLFLWAVASSD